ncbi:MAG: hypothetical protein ACXWWN_04055 [Gemmatimonadales bacterium]
MPEDTYPHHSGTGSLEKCHPVLQKGVVVRLISAGLLALLGCGTDPDSFSHCAANIAVSVSHEINPEFAWTPAECAMSELNRAGNSFDRDRTAAYRVLLYG